MSQRKIYLMKVLIFIYNEFAHRRRLREFLCNKNKSNDKKREKESKREKK